MIQFVLNNKLIQLEEIRADKTLLDFLRTDQGLTGSKEGCAEGDCGACTVVIAELVQEEIIFKTVNACIQFVPTLDSKAVFTVEYLRQSDGSLHPVQQAMVDEHGSQCGFCTPGFIMSLWAVYNKHQRNGSRPDRTEVRSALTGNLCRCTGYRPILDAAEKMFDLPDKEFNLDELQTQLLALQHDKSLHHQFQNTTFYAPKTIKELVELRSEYPQANILAGGTDVGLWVNKQFRELDTIIYTIEVEELKKVETDDNKIRIGAAVSLTDSYKAISAHYPEMDQMWERFASMPIRNVGTLGGNVANGSPIGDSMPALISLGAKVILRSTKGSRSMLLQDFYIDYMKKDLQPEEIVEAIELPLPISGQIFRCYKLSKRYDSDISAVFAAFAITFNTKNGETIEECRITYGGMAAIPKRATLCEQSLVGQEWSEASVRNAMKILQQDYSPMSDMRASEQNRVQSAANLLYRFYLETRLVNPLPHESLSVFANA